MICETKLTIYGYFFVGRNSLQQPKQRLWDSITPAYAGKSKTPTSLPLSNWYYPRLRGEKSLQRLRIIQEFKLPPLTRGKVHNNHRPPQKCGITPACAGKSN